MHLDQVEYHVKLALLQNPEVLNNFLICFLGVHNQRIFMHGLDHNSLWAFKLFGLVC